MHSFRCPTVRHVQSISEMKCKNCGEIVKEKYCGYCGQNSNITKIQLSSLLRDLSESVFQINRGFLFTLIELFARPGTTIRDFLNGKRVNYFKPISYLLILSTFYFLIALLVDQETWMSDSIIGFYEGASSQTSKIAFPPLVTWFTQNYAYSSLLLIPVFSLASYLSFSKFGSNYLEHIVLNSYITGQQAIFYAVLTSLNAIISSDTLEVVPIFISMFYCIYVFIKFFANGRASEIILRSILTYALHALFSTMLLSLMMLTQIFQ